MEIYQILTIAVPYLVLGGLSAFSAEISRTPRGMRPPAFNSVALEFGLALYWFLLMAASIVIFFITSFVFIAVLFVVSVILSPLTITLGRKIYCSLVVTPLYNDIEKKPPHEILLWGRLLFIPILFVFWIVSLFIVM